MKRFVCFAFITTLLVSTAAAAYAETWKFSHTRPQNARLHEDAQWFADTVKKATNGEVSINIYPANALGDYTVVQERVGLGAIDMACQTAAAAADRRMQIVSFPYLMKDWAQAKENFVTGAPFLKIIGDLYAKQGITLLAAYPMYFGGIALSKKPENYQNPTAPKGLKLRVPPAKTFQLIADNSGFIGTPLPYSEAFAAMQTGVVDGVLGAGAEGYYASFRDVTKFYLPVNTHFEVYFLIVNTELFESQPQSVRDAVLDSAKQFEVRRWSHAEKDQAHFENELAKYGAEVLALSPEQLDAYAKHVRENSWPAVLEDIGKEWGQKALDTIR